MIEYNVSNGLHYFSTKSGPTSLILLMQLECNVTGLIGTLRSFIFCIWLNDFLLSFGPWIKKVYFCGILQKYNVQHHHLNDSYFLYITEDTKSQVTFPTNCPITPQYNYLNVAVSRQQMWSRIALVNLQYSDIKHDKGRLLLVKKPWGNIWLKYCYLVIMLTKQMILIAVHILIISTWLMIWDVAAHAISKPKHYHGGI